MNPINFVVKKLFKKNKPEGPNLPEAFLWLLKCWVLSATFNDENILNDYFDKLEDEHKTVFLDIDFF